MNNKETFLHLYNELENALRLKYPNVEKGVSLIQHIRNQPEYDLDKYRIDYMRIVRNMLVHDSALSKEFEIEPNSALINWLRRFLNRITNPPKVTSIAIPMSKVLSCTLDDEVLPVMHTMLEKVYTHVPVINNGVVSGVFSENTILAYLTDEEIIEVEDGFTFSDIKQYLPIDQHRSESFRFVSKDTTISSISKLFNEAVQKGDRIGMVFITEHGRNNEKPIGIVTAWDLAGRTD